MSEQSLGTLYAEICIRHTALMADVAAVKAQFKGLADDSTKQAKRIDDAMALKGATAALGQKLSTFVTLPILAAGAAGLKFAASIESQEMAFASLLGSMQKGKALYADLIQLSAKTPLQLPDVTKAAQSLLAFGTNAGQLQSKIMMLGDVSMGNAEKLDRVVQSYGRMQSSGKVTLETLNIMTEAGIPIVAALAKEYNVTTGALYTMISKSQVGFAQVDNALKAMTFEGGQFYNMMKNVGEQTATGKLSTAIDNLRLASAELMKDMVPTLKSVLDGVSNVMNGFINLDAGTKKMILSFMGMAAAVGPIVMVASAVQKLGAAMALLVANPVTAAIMAAVGAGMILVPLMQKISTADKDAAEIAGKRLKAAKDHSDEVKRLTDRYSELSKKTILSNTESKELADVAGKLKTLYPQLSTVYDANTQSLRLSNDQLERANTLSNKKLQEAKEQLDATYGKQFAKFNDWYIMPTWDEINDYTARQNKAAKIIQEVTGSKKAIQDILNDKTLMNTGYKVNYQKLVDAANSWSWLDGQIKLDKDNLDKYWTSVRKLKEEKDAAEEAIFGKPAADAPPSTVTAPASGNAADTKSQFARLKALDEEWKARIARISQGSAEEEAAYKEYQSKRSDLLDTFNKEDIEKGMKASDSLKSYFKDQGTVYKTMGEEMTATKAIYTDKMAAIMASLQSLADAKHVSVEMLMGDPKRTEEVLGLMKSALDSLRDRIDGLIQAGGDQAAFRSAVEPIITLYNSLSEKLGSLPSPFEAMMKGREDLRKELDDTRVALDEAYTAMVKFYAAGNSDAGNEASSVITMLLEKIKKLEEELNGISAPGSGNGFAGLQEALSKAFESGNIAQITEALQNLESGLDAARGKAGTTAEEFDKWGNAIDQAKVKARQLAETKIQSYLGIANDIADAIKTGVTDGWGSVDWGAMTGNLAVSIGTAVGGPEGAAIGGIVQSFMQIGSTLQAIMEAPVKRANEEAKRQADEAADYVKRVTDGIAASLSESVSRGDSAGSIFDQITAGLDQNKIDDFKKTVGDLIADTKTVHHDGQWLNPFTNGGMFYQLPYDQIVQTSVNQLIVAWQNADTADAKLAIQAQIIAAIQAGMDAAGIESAFSFSGMVQGLDSILTSAVKTGNFSDMRSALKDKIFDAIISQMVETTALGPIKSMIDALYNDDQTLSPSDMSTIIAKAEAAVQALRLGLDPVWGSLTETISTSSSDMVSGLSDALGNAAWSADFSSFKLALGSQLKSAILEEIAQDATYKAAVQKILDDYFSLKTDGLSAADMAVLIGDASSAYSVALGQVGDLAALFSSMGLEDASVTVKNQGTMITQLTGDDRDWFTETIKSLAAQMQPLLQLNQASIATFNATQVIINSISIHNDTVNVYAADGADIKSLISDMVIQALN